jgi:hypothetical protein
MKKSPTPTTSITIRIPDEIKSRIDELAAKEIRSINNEIIFLLTFALDNIQKPVAKGR